MKKIKLLLSILIICLTFAIVGCSKTLSAPVDLAVEGNVLSWTAVDNATNYLIDINGDERITARTTYSLSMLSEGDYVIKIKARDSKNEFNDSEWSQEITFTKEYESGLEYVPVNSNTEYAVKNVGKAYGDVKIEDTYNGKPVTQILERAFYGSGSLKSVEIGKNVKIIGDRAFQNCSYLASVIIPEGVTSIGEYAFQSCRVLESVELPSTIENISSYAFRYCHKLTDVTIGGVKTIAASSFENCRMLKKVTITDSVKAIGGSAFAQCPELDEVDLGNGVETIGDHAFFNCVKLQTVKGGNCVSEIAESAFEKCVALSSFNFAESVKKIGARAFSGCTALSEITINGNLASIGVNAFVETAATEVDNGIIYAGNWIIGSDSTLTAVTFREGVVGIGDYAFSRSSVERLRIPDTVKYIGNYAFSNCDSLSYLNIGAGVIDIGRYAFANCDILGQGFVSLGTNVETIQSYAFYKSPNFGSPAYMQQNPITIPATVKSIGTSAFKDTMFWKNTQAGEIVYVGDWAVGYIDDAEAQHNAEIKEGAKGISDYAFANCASLNSITIGDSVSVIGIAAVYGCTGLSQVLLSNGSELEYLGDYMFYRCTRLQSIRLPVTIDKIGRSAFYKSGLLSIEISRWISEIGPYAFFGCESLLAVDFINPEQSLLTEIDEYTFSGCLNLVRINVPDSVVKIGYKAFNKCERLETISLGGGLMQLDGYAFYNCTSLKEISMPDSLEVIGEKAFYKCIALASLKLGSNLKSIGSRAFYNCAALENIILPVSLEVIGEYAFKGCNSLTSVVLGENIREIGAHAFYGCKFLTVFCEAESLPERWSVRWNSGMRPVIWGCELSADKTFVVSFENAEGRVINDKARNGFSNPLREGYVFAGWSAVTGGEEKIFTFGEFTEIPPGATLTAVWTEAAEGGEN